MNRNKLHSDAFMYGFVVLILLTFLWSIKCSEHNTADGIPLQQFYNKSATKTFIHVEDVNRLYSLQAAYYQLGCLRWSRSNVMFG